MIGTFTLQFSSVSSFYVKLLTGKQKDKLTNVFIFIYSFIIIMPDIQLYKQ